MRELHSKSLKHLKLDIHFYSHKVCYSQLVYPLYIPNALSDQHMYATRVLVRFCRQINNLLTMLTFFILSIKDNIGGTDINQGVVAVYNLESSISNDELRRMFGIYGEIKEVSAYCFDMIFSFLLI